MKKIWIIIVLCVLSHGHMAYSADYESLSNDMNSAFESFVQNMNNDYDTYIENNAKSYDIFKSDIEKKWAKFKDSTVTDWVQYNDDLSVRSSVDFKNGFVEFEALLYDDTENAKREALQQIEKQIRFIDEQCRENAGFDIAVDIEEVQHKSEIRLVPQSLDEHEIQEPEPITPAPVGATKKDNKPEMKSRDDIGKEKAPYIMTVKTQLPSDYLQKAAHKYRDLVYSNGNRFDIKSNVIYAIIHTESYFNPFARSHVPAFGLMQLVPSTGGKDAYEFVYNKSMKPSADYLYNPKNNILLGTAYFSKIKNVYFKGVHNAESAYILSIAAYNTGIGNVAKAITGTKSLKNVASIVNSMTPSEVCAVLLQKLPYDETKKYLEHILNRSAMYRGI